MKSDQQENSEENINIQTLRKKIAELIADNDKFILKKQNQQSIQRLISGLTKKGFIRTHSFVFNSLRELFSSGEMKPKVVKHEVDYLPWKWDQTKKYLDELYRADIITYSRDSFGRLNCKLKVGPKTKISNQLTRLFNYLRNSEKLPNINPEIHQSYTSYYQKKKTIDEMKTAKTNAKIRQANTKEVTNFKDKIVRAYFMIDYEHGDFSGNLVEIIKKEPLMLFSLVKEGD